MIAIVFAQMADVLNLILISFHEFLIIALKNFNDHISSVFFFQWLKAFLCTLLCYEKSFICTKILCLFLRNWQKKIFFPFWRRYSAQKSVYLTTNSNINLTIEWIAIVAISNKNNNRLYVFYFYFQCHIVQMSVPYSKMELWRLKHFIWNSVCHWLKPIVSCIQMRFKFINSQNPLNLERRRTKKIHQNFKYWSESFSLDHKMECDNYLPFDATHLLR